MERRGREDTLSELGGLLTALSAKPVVAVRYGAFPGGASPGDGPGPLADQIHGLVAELHRTWKRYLPSGATPPSASEIEGLLEPLGADAAIELMATLAADNLVWPGSKLMNREIADDTVTRIVHGFGADATWWTNRQGASWDAVTACTFDGVVAGSDGEYFAILIQVGED
ncbi:hypothetical protein ACFYNM_11495 [Streptomyces spororaveus]|uniref:hypothetical protein n=1 Tax=Streptomyces spororaveus TaxID=284039 RepID=UPI00368452B0